MDNPTPYTTPPGAGMGQRDLPNAILVLVLGILSIPTSCCLFIGLILAILALVFNSRDQRMYEANPDLYTRSSYSNLSIGKVCAIIGLVLGILFLVSTVLSLVINGGLFFEQLREQIRENQSHDESLLIIHSVQRFLTFIC